MRPGTSPALHVALIVLLTVLAYATSLRGGFVSDDVRAVAENPLLRSLAPANLLTMFRSFDDANYIPLKVLSLAIDYRLWGSTPAGYHVTNVVIHAACALVVYAVLLRLGESASLALVVALLWALHPVQVESVAWISERKNVLSTLFFLLAFRVYLRASDQPSRRVYALLFTLFLCALLSKLNTIVLPAIALAYETILRRRLRRRDVIVAVLLLVPGAVIAWINLHENPSHGGYYHGGDLGVTLRTSATVVPRYLGLVVAPLHLQSYYAVPLRASWLEPDVALALVVIAGLVLATALLAWRGRAEGFWLAWFGITLSPMLNLVPFPALMADRYLYIPILGLLVIAARGARALALRVPLLRPALPALAAAAVGILGWLTIARVPIWMNAVSLWADWARRTSYYAADDPWRAPPRSEEKRILREELARHPDRAALHNNLGAFAFEEGRMPDAIEALERAWQLDPSDPAIALNLGSAYLHAGRIEDAIPVLEEAVRLEPPSYYAHLNLARAYARSGDADRAREQLERARRIRPFARDAL